MEKLSRLRLWLR